MTPSEGALICRRVGHIWGGPSNDEPLSKQCTRCGTTKLLNPDGTPRPGGYRYPADYLR